jgi:hypothetical protein
MWLGLELLMSSSSSFDLKHLSSCTILLLQLLPRTAAVIITIAMIAATIQEILGERLHIFRGVRIGSC